VGGAGDEKARDAVADDRTRYFRDLSRLRSAARRWTVYAGTFAGATLVLIPYKGLGWPDAIWAALTGGSTALAVWRWRDHQELASQPVPEPVPASEIARTRIEALVSKLPAGRSAVAELHRMQARARIRGSSVVPGWTRLDQAAQTLAGFAGRLGGAAESAILEANVAERALRDLGERTAAVERGLLLAPRDSILTQAHKNLLGHFNQGVTAYEKLVAAAAGYVAEDSTTVAGLSAVTRLTEATDLLRGVAVGLSELRTAATAPRSATPAA
jgi:hypothetical protein